MKDFTWASDTVMKQRQTQGTRVWEMGRYGEADEKQSIQKKHWLSLFPTVGQLVGTPCLHSQEGCGGGGVGGGLAAVVAVVVAVVAAAAAVVAIGGVCQGGC